jgi:hypothetical protein
VRDGVAAPGGHGALHSRPHEPCAALAVAGPQPAAAPAPPPRASPPARSPAGHRICRGDPAGVGQVLALLVAVLTLRRTALTTKIPCYRYVEHSVSVGTTIRGRSSGCSGGAVPAIATYDRLHCFPYTSTLISDDSRAGSVQGRCVSKPSAPPLRRFGPALRWNE